VLHVLPFPRRPHLEIGEGIGGGFGDHRGSRRGRMAAAGLGHEPHPPSRAARGHARPRESLVGASSGTCAGAAGARPAPADFPAWRRRRRRGPLAAAVLATGVLLACQAFVRRGWFGGPCFADLPALPHRSSGERPLGGRRRPLRVGRPATASTVPDIWTAGPAKVNTGYAQKALYLLKNEPMLFDSAVDSVLEALREQRDQDLLSQKPEPSEAGQDLLTLQQRMLQVKQNERAKIVSELLYLKVCAMFASLEVPMIPPVKAGGSMNFGHFELEGLTTRLYSKDMLDLVKEYVRDVTRPPNAQAQSAQSFELFDHIPIFQIPMLHAAKIYHSAAIVGYWLRQVDARYQLEKLLRAGLGTKGDGAEDVTLPQAELKPLRDYLRNFGREHVHSMFSIASVEGRASIENQVTALFGDLRVLNEKIHKVIRHVPPEYHTEIVHQAVKRNEVESLCVNRHDFKRLVYEGVAYGALLNDAEQQVDMHFELTPAPAGPFDFDAPIGDDGETGRYLNE